MPQQPWFLSSTPVLSQLGATMGYGVTPTAAQLAGVRALGDATANEDARRWDLNYQQNKQQLDQQYDISRRNARTAEERAEIDKWYNREQVKIARERLSQEDRQFNLTHGLNQAKLGYDLLNMGAQMRGPADYFQAAEFARGVAGNPQTSTFLSALQNNTGLAGFGAQGGLPDKETLGTLQAKLTGQGGNPNVGNYRAQIGNIAAKGAHQLGAGSLESLTDTERNLFMSGLGSLGVDTKTFMDQYARSRVGQGIGATRAA